MTGSRMLVVGMPNVGKSSLLNAMRKVGTGSNVKAAITGGQPGVTRKIATGVKISEDPLVYLIDSPGGIKPLSLSHFFTRANTSFSRRVRAIHAQPPNHALARPCRLR